MANKNSRSKIAKRREQILELLQKNGKVYIAELSETFSTSLVTIRSDLDALAQEGKLVRMAGGAVLPGNTEPGNERMVNYSKKKGNFRNGGKSYSRRRHSIYQLWHDHESLCRSLEK